MNMGAIQGIGVDVVDVQRLRKVIEEQAAFFLNKVFTTPEIEYCRARKNPHEHYAARFAAKEAVAKAMRTGWSGAFRWKDVEVVNEPSGAPSVILYKEVADALADSVLHLSMSHTENTVVAFVVIESKAPRKARVSRSPRKPRSPRTKRTARKK
jgi:holo-[acyl-carrier protein] synthase